MKKACRESFRAYLRNVKLFAKTRANSQKAISQLWVEALAKQLVEELKVLYKTKDLEELVDLVRYQTGVDKRTLSRFIELGKMPHPRVLERIVVYSNCKLVIKAVPQCSNDHCPPVAELCDHPGTINHKIQLLLIGALLRSSRCKANKMLALQNSITKRLDQRLNENMESSLRRHFIGLPKVVVGKPITFVDAQLILRNYDMKLMIHISR
jgi:hypothetical protein